MRDPRVALSFHEAGHAVAAVAYGASIDLATIRASGDMAGHVRVAAFGQLDPGVQLIIFLAGGVAEARFRDRPFMLDAFDQDRNQVDRILRGLHGQHRHPETSLALRRNSPWYLHTISATRALVNARWRSIAGVAQRLRVRETIGHAEVVAGFC